MTGGKNGRHGAITSEDRISAIYLNVEVVSRSYLLSRVSGPLDNPGVLKPAAQPRHA